MEYQAPKLFPQFDRRAAKARAWDLSRSAQVSAKKMTAFFLLILLGLSLADTLVSGPSVQSMLKAGFFALFLSILIMLINLVLSAGYTLYCMGVRQGRRMEYLTLFDGFSLVGKVLAVFFLQFLFVSLWAMLFVIPGIIAAYRYSFALYNLLEHPEISASEAINMSKAQTNGCKMELFILDLSFFFWHLLANLPYSIVNAMALQEIPLPPALLTTLVCGLLSGIVDLWRLPYTVLAQLEYFEIAKQLTGVGLPPQEDNQLPPPDDTPLF